MGKEENMKESGAKKPQKRKKAEPKYTYLREVEIRYKKRKVEIGAGARRPISGAEQVVKLFSDLQNETKEKLIAISLDIKLKIISFEVVAIGSVESIYARPAETIRASILVNAYGVIVVHNHPSGDPTPSIDDKEYTRKLLRSCRDLGIHFHDHIIIGDDRYFSFAEKRLILL